MKPSLILRYALIATSVMGLQTFASQQNQPSLNQAELALMLYRGKNALMISSAAKNNEDQALLLLTLPGVDVNFRDGAGRTALHYAAQFGLEKLARKLIELGADKTITDDDEKTALAVAQTYKKAGMIALLLNKN